MDRAHIRNGSVIKLYNGEKGWVDLENGQRHSPPQVGYVNKNDRIVDYTKETVDNSTGKNIVIEESRTITDTSVVDTTTIRDMTPEELDTEDESELSALDRSLMKATHAAIYKVITGGVPAEVRNPSTYRQWIKSMLR